MKRIAVLASGGGSNFAALVAAQARFASYRVVLLVSNVASSGVIAKAHEAGIENLVIPSRGAVREEHDRAVLEALAPHAIDILCLAGYMRVLSPSFITGFRGPILNIHPSLLPAFPGLHAQRQAIEAGVRWSGVTVHFVDSGLDSGPIILQEPVHVEQEDVETSLSARILATEHRLYPMALDFVAREAFRIDGRKVHLFPEPTI